MTGLDVEASSTTVEDGDVFLDPIPGDMLRTFEDKPQVLCFVLGRTVHLFSLKLKLLRARSHTARRNRKYGYQGHFCDCDCDDLQHCNVNSTIEML